MSNLTPEKRLDKNGKLVTRHVSDHASQQPKISLPPPDIKTPPAQEKLEKVFEIAGIVDESLVQHVMADLDMVDDLDEIFSEQPEALADFAQMHEVEEYLLKAPDCIIEDISEKLQKGSSSADYSLVLATAIKNGASYPDLEVINTFYSHKGQIDDENDENAYVSCKNALDRLREYETTHAYKVPESLLQTSSHEVDLAIDLAALTFYLPRKSKTPEGAQDRHNVAQMLIDNPQQGSQILEVVMDRNTCDIEFIQQVLNESVVPLREGQL